MPGKHIRWVTKKREEKAKVEESKLERAAQLLYLKADQRVKEVAVHHHRHKKLFIVRYVRPMDRDHRLSRVLLGPRLVRCFSCVSHPQSSALS
jgi:hypothetical protein